jgi:hypothetical protein
MLFPAVGINFGSLRRHRRIQDHRQDWNALFVFKFPNEIKNFLRAADRESRDQDLAVVFSRMLNYSFQRNLWLFRVVCTITVG